METFPSSQFALPYVEKTPGRSVVLIGYLVVPCRSVVSYRGSFAVWKCFSCLRAAGIMPSERP